MTDTFSQCGVNLEEKYVQNVLFSILTFPLLTWLEKHLIYEKVRNPSLTLILA